MRKKVAITISASLAVVLIFIAVVITAMFAPRSLKRQISQNGVVSVTLFSHDPESYELSNLELEKFWNSVNRAKYKPLYDPLKGESLFKVSIKYDDGSKIEFDEFRMRKYGADGTRKEAFEMDLKMDFFDEFKYKFYPWNIET